MVRFTLTTLFLFLVLGLGKIFAQLPNQNGQVWCEYAVAVPQSNVKIFDAKQGTVHEDQTPSSIVEFIKRETGDAAWTGENFGLINSDGRKLYVYHSPAMQQRVAEIVGRFMRPETKNVQFATECRFVTLSERFAREKGISDIREPIYQYLHPIISPPGLPVQRTPGVSAYWVAKDDIPKLYEVLSDLAGIAMSDRDSNILQAPRVTTFNGQLGNIQDTAQTPFVTDMITVQKESGTEYQPNITIFNEGQAIRSFSLLSWDRRTATTDIAAEFSKITKVDKMNVAQSAPLAKQLQTPHLAKIELSEHGLVWPVDGMLIVFLGGIERQTETRTEVGTPMLNKIPYFKRLFMNTAIGRETVAVHGILTVKMVDEPTALAASACGAINQGQR